MMVLIPGGGGRDGIGSAWSGRMLFMKLRSPQLAARVMMPAPGRQRDPASSKVQPNIIVIPGRAQREPQMCDCTSGNLVIPGLVLRTIPE
jgi:hypothetical protein